MNQQPGKAVFSIKFGCILVGDTSTFCPPKEQGAKEANFVIKRHVVLKKTTRCFEENDTLFYRKRHVVLRKTTRCFSRGRKIIGQSSENVFFTMRLAEKCDTCDSKKHKLL